LRLSLKKQRLQQRRPHPLLRQHQQHLLLRQHPQQRLQPTKKTPTA